jgi:ketosteroid isomerase-like protein
MRSTRSACTPPTPRGKGETLQDNTALVFHVRDGKVIEVRQYWADPYTADKLFA